MNERIKQRGVKKAREALAERVLSELTRSEEHRLSQGGVTTDDIKAERAKRRKTDPKAQRYMARGVRKPRGQEPDNAAAGHIRRLAGQRAATKRQNKKYADAKAAGNVTKVVTASTEIVKNGRMALAEKVLEAFQKGLKDKARAIQQASPGTRNQSAVDQAARATGDATIKKAQGKNTPRSVFGGKSNQTSTTAGGGTLGQELAKTKPESQHSMNRRGSSTVDKKKVAANLADAKSGRNAANLKKEIDADTEKRRAAKRAEG